MKNQPAFPGVDETGEPYTGMTLRDYFAAKAMPIVYQYWMNDFYHPDFEDAELRNSEGRNDFDTYTITSIAEDCYEMADAMLKVREV